MAVTASACVHALHITPSSGVGPGVVPSCSICRRTSIPGLLPGVVSNRAPSPPERLRRLLLHINVGFCVTRSQFAAGWLNGGNQRLFGAMAAASSTPMGILASRAAEPVGWCACGPRSRYVAATSPRSKIMRNRARDEDEIVWLLPCPLRPGRAPRPRGNPRARACGVELACREGASAIEGWPLAGSERRSDDAFVGREQVFEDLGFNCVERPSRERVIMRLELRGIE
jgi:hypothetical protein